MRKTITIREASNIYGVPQPTLRTWCEQGKLPAHKVVQKWFLDAAKTEELFIGIQTASAFVFMLVCLAVVVFA